MSSEKLFSQNFKDQRSEPIRANILNYIQNFDTIFNYDKEILGQRIQEFITKLIVDYVRIWKISLNQNTNQLYNDICDNFENKITKPLYSKLFSSNDQEVEEDYIFEQKLKKLDFITPKHLDIDESVIRMEYMDFAIKKLSSINEYKTPKDKIIVLFNFCNIITSMLSEQSKNRSNIAGADEVYPLVVYAILKGNIRKFKSNMNYIKHFRHHTRLESAEEYYFTTIYTAIGFIENLKYNNLNISENEFCRLSKISDEKLIESIKLPKNVFKRNNDENCLIYFLTEKQNNNVDYIEFKEVKQNILINTESVISKNLLYNTNLKFPLLSVDLDKLYKEYFNIEFIEFSISKLEKMFNDFKIILRLVDSFIKSYVNNLNTIPINNEKTVNSTPKINNKKIHIDFKEKDNYNLIEL